MIILWNRYRSLKIDFENYSKCLTIKQEMQAREAVITLNSKCDPQVNLARNIQIMGIRKEKSAGI
jgi:hypothetical protein